MEDYCSYPPIDATPDKKKEFVKKIINPLNRYRLWQQYRMALNLWFYRGAQWIKAPRQLVANGSGGFRFELDSRDGFKFNLPVDNYIATNVDNAVSRFLRKQYKPDVQAEKNVPELLAAARLNRDILTHDHRAKDWRDVEHEMAFDFETSGTTIGKTWFDETVTELIPIASTDAVSCPSCEQKFASPKVPAALHQAQILPSDDGPVPLLSPETATVEGDEATLAHCPLCGQGELQPYQPSVQEAAGQKDFLGRGLGEWVPKGEPVLEGLSWSEYYPENGGIGVEPHTVKCHAQKSPRSVDWVKARFPEFKDVKPDDAVELMRSHPTLGMQLVFGGGMAAMYDEGIYDNHVAFLEVHIDPMPYPGLEMGHSIYQVGEEIISKPLCVEVQPPQIEGQPIEGLSTEARKIKRVQYHIARRKRVPREFWGRTPVDDQIPLQRRLNRLDAQVEDIRERGIPWAAVPEGVEFYDRDDVDGTLRVVEYASDNPSWTIKDSIVNAQPLTGNAYILERDKVTMSLQRLGAQDVELGKNPVGAKTIGQLQILAEEAQQQRGPAEEDLRRAWESMFGHHLELRWAFQRTKTDMEVEGTEQSFERQSYEATDILGQTKVRIEAKGAIDKSVIQAEIAFKAKDAGLYELTTFSARDEFLEIIGAPKVDHATSYQVERANQAWFEFKQSGQVPVVDEYSHNVALWYQILVDQWMSDEALQLQREGEWDNVLRKIAGWERYLLQAEQQDETQRAVYEGQDPAAWGQIYQQGTMAVQQAQATFQAASAANPQTPPPAMSSFPAPPQSGKFLPNALDQKLLMIWQGLLGPAFPQPQVIAMIQGPAQVRVVKRERLIRMYAVLQQCRLLTERKAAAMMPPPTEQPAPAQAPMQGAA